MRARMFVVSEMAMATCYVTLPMMTAVVNGALSLTRAAMLATLTL